MSPQEYIETGILERFVLGDVSDQERQQVQCMSKIYPEIRAEMEQLESAMGEYASAFAQAPPDPLKTKVLAAMAAAGQDAPKVTPNNKDAAETPVIPISKASTGNPLWLAAASLVLLAMLGIVYVYLSGQVQTETDRNLALTLDKVHLQAEINAAKESTQQLTSELAIVNDTATRRIQMKGVGSHTASLATVYWNTTSTEAYLSVNNLPAPSEEQQYQLWAIVEGVPVDLGVFDADSNSLSLQAMKGVQNAQAFAVTLEKRGGSPSPNLEQLYVLGNVEA